VPVTDFVLYFFSWQCIEQDQKRIDEIDQEIKVFCHQSEAAWHLEQYNRIASRTSKNAWVYGGYMEMGM